ncbi:hypothetical protein HHI36_001107 [Cryptolaemus montrouzieri]|uniref:Uncharacterized protein n=1 Tax=Cryptolaemus montrouzieri TaxID=559131 RepID=A0ABD2P7D0_9CUCU
MTQEKQEDEYADYIDIILPDETEEQQHYIDRLVKREKPISWISREVSWPKQESLLYESTPEYKITPMTVSASFELINRNEIYGEEFSNDAESRNFEPSLNEYVLWPPHSRIPARIEQIEDNSMAEFSSEDEIERCSVQYIQHSLEEDLKKDYLQEWHPKEYPTNFERKRNIQKRKDEKIQSLASAKLFLSQEEITTPIWKGFNWPIHANLEKTELLNEAKATVKSDNLDMDFNWPAHFKYKIQLNNTYVTETNAQEEITTPLWKGFNWPFHANLEKTNLLNEAKATVKSDNLDMDFNWPAHFKYKIQLNTTDVTETNAQEEITTPLWKGFNWPLHANLEKTNLLNKAKATVKSDNLDMDFNWPEHFKYEIQLNSTDVTETNAQEEITTPLWKGFNWPLHANLEKTKLLNETKATVKSDNLDMDFNWPEHFKYEIQLNTDVTETNADEEVTTPLWKGFNWPLHANLEKTKLLNEAKATVKSDNLDMDFNWPEHFKYEIQLNSTDLTETNAQEEITTPLWKGFNWPLHANLEKTKLLNETKATVKSDNLDMDFNWPEHFKYEIQLKTDVTKTNAQEEITTPLWKGFNWPFHASLEKSELLNEAKTTVKSNNNFNMDFNWPENFKYDIHLNIDTTKSNVITETNVINIDKINQEYIHEQSNDNIFNSKGKPVWNINSVSTQSTGHVKLIQDSTIASSGKNMFEKSKLLEESNWPTHMAYEGGFEGTQQPLILNTISLKNFHLPFSEASRYTYDENKNEMQKLYNDRTESQVQLFNWPEYLKFPRKFEKTTGHKSTNWEEGHKPVFETMHLNSSDNIGEAFGKNYQSLKGTVDDEETWRNWSEVNPGIQETQYLEEYLKHTTRIIEKAFSPDELTSKNYILDGSNDKKTTDIWEAFQWPPPRLLSNTHSSWKDEIHTEDFLSSTLIWEAFNWPKDELFQNNFGNTKTTKSFIVPEENRDELIEDAESRSNSRSWDMFNWPEYKTSDNNTYSEKIKQKGEDYTAEFSENFSWSPPNGQLNEKSQRFGEKDIELSQDIPSAETPTEFSDIFVWPSYNPHTYTKIEEGDQKNVIAASTESSLEVQILETAPNLPEERLTSDKSIAYVPNELYNDTSSEAAHQELQRSTDFWESFNWPGHGIYEYQPTNKYEKDSFQKSEFWTSEKHSLGPDDQKKSFWSHKEKKIHHNRVSTTERFPTKFKMDIIKSSTPGEKIELVEDITNFTKHPKVQGETSITELIKSVLGHTFRTPVKESEDDDSLWNFRVLNEDEVITFHPRSRSTYFILSTTERIYIIIVVMSK